MTSQSDAARLLEAFVESLNMRDADLLASLFTADADWVDIFGHWQRGRQAVHDGHVGAFSGLLASGTTSVTEFTESDLSDGVTLCHALWEIPAHDSPTGQPLPGRSGVMTIVVVRTGEAVRIRAGQNTEIPGPRA